MSEYFVVCENKCLENIKNFSKYRAVTSNVPLNRVINLNTKEKPSGIRLGLTTNVTSSSEVGNKLHITCSKEGYMSYKDVMIGYAYDTDTMKIYKGLVCIELTDTTITIKKAVYIEVGTTNIVNAIGLMGLAVKE